MNILFNNILKNIFSPYQLSIKFRKNVYICLVQVKVSFHFYLVFQNLKYEHHPFFHCLIFRYTENKLRIMWMCQKVICPFSWNINIFLCMQTRKVNIIHTKRSKNKPRLFFKSIKKYVLIILFSKWPIFYYESLSPICEIWSSIIFITLFPLPVSLFSNNFFDTLILKG